jgi:hypothetical protein
LTDTSGNGTRSVRTRTGFTWVTGRVQSIVPGHGFGFFTLP